MDPGIFPFSNLNHLDLNNLLNENNRQYTFPLHILNNLNYDPFKYNDNVEDINNLPFDCGIFKPDCKYVFCDDGSISGLESPLCLNLLAHNISSIPLHLESCVEQCINTTNVKFDVLGFCETRLHDGICQLYSIDNYNNYFNNRNSHGGGVAIYISKNYQVRELKDVYLQLPHIEALFLEIIQPIKFIVGIIYRPPNSNVSDFFSSIEEIISTISAARLPTYIMGDFNINILNHNDNNVQNFVNIFHSYSFFSTISKPTRVTNNSATIIDHIWTNNMDNYQTSGIFFNSISDHFPIFSSFTTTRKTSEVTTLTKRTFTAENINAFKSDLASFNWKPLPLNNDTNGTFDSYISKFLELYNKNFPKTIIKIKEKHMNKPYITHEIKNYIKHRNKLQKLYAKWPLTYDRIFKSYRNKVNSIIKKAKEDYFKMQTQIFIGDPRKTWETINTLLGKNKRNLPVSFNINGDSVSDPNLIASSFNNYFSNIGNNLASKIQDTSHQYSNYLPSSVPFSFYLRPTTLNEVSSVIRNMKSASPGHDEIHIRVIKDCCDEISQFLVVIINKSFQEGIFPKHLQIARIVPVFKKGDSTLIHNYRPISILPCFSKIFEKILVTRLMDYLSTNSILTNVQYGFRPKYSTDLAIHHLCQNIYNALDSKMFQLTAFCDLTKAFDTISHNILLEKLEVYGIRGNAKNWIKSYLAHRRQFTVYNNVTSPQNSITCGVPQGSVLGPILFLIYINDIIHSSNKLKFLLFADDTTIFIQGNNLADISLTLNTELQKVSKWIMCNKLTLNYDKSQFMVSSPLMTPAASISIKINELELKEVSDLKFLGLVIDNKLKWNKHIESVKSKVSVLTGIIYRLRDYVSINCLRQIYLSLIYPHLLYCSATWGGAYTTLIDSLYTTQKKLLRVMCFKKPYDHTACLFKNLNLLKLPDIITLQTNLFVHKSFHSFPIDTGFNCMPFNNTPRRPHSLRIPLCRTSHAQRSILIRGSRSWNNLSDELTSITNTKTFKFTFLKSLLDQYEQASM